MSTAGLHLKGVKAIKPLLQVKQRHQLLAQPAMSTAPHWQVSVGRLTQMLSARPALTRFTALVGANTSDSGSVSGCLFLAARPHHSGSVHSQSVGEHWGCIRGLSQMHPHDEELIKAGQQAYLMQLRLCSSNLGAAARLTVAF